MAIKTKMFILCLFALVASFPVHAVTEPIKVLQYSIRNVHKGIEVIQNTASLVSSVQNSILQGSLAIVKSSDFRQVTDLKKFAPTVSDDVKGLINHGNIVPNVRSYIEKELENVNFEDVFEQRDALVDISKDLNIASMEAISLGKKFAAELNDAVHIDKKQLSTAADAINQQQKQTQEAAIELTTAAGDAELNQLRSTYLVTRAQKIMADIRKSAIEKNGIVRTDKKGQEGMK